MEPTSGAVARPRDAHPEDRRVITAAFIDLSGSTALAERLDPEELRALMSAYLETVSDEIRRFGGSIEKYIGDAVVAVWGAPVAREDDARQALEAALAVRSAMRALNERLQAESRPQLEVRIGINSGRVVAGDLPGVGERTYLISGDAMNTAQRLESAAAPGEILVGALTHHLTDDAFTFGEPRRVVAKGKRLPFEAFPLIANLPAGLARPVVSPLVGRDAELDSFDIAFGALRSGSGGMSLIVADAGLGKSRLLSEAKRRATGIKWLEGRALRMRRESSYSPFREALLAEIGLDAGASERDVWDASLSRAEQLLGETQTDTGAYIAALLGVTQPPPGSGITYPEAEELGRQIRRAAKAYLVALAREQPTVVALEDWHWADGASSELLAHLLPVAAREPLFFVVVGRPDDESPIAPLLKRAGTRPLQLGRLTEVATRELIDNLLDGEVPAAVVRPIAATTEGNPYFIEEVVRSLLEAGTLRRDGGSWRIGNDSAAIRIPERVEAVIAERLDRLSDVPKAIVRAASVVGREFRSEVVEHVTDLGDELPGVLGSLTRLGLIERTAQGDSSYRFRHVLIQETAYEGILAQRRRELHGRVAAYLEEHPGAGGDEPALAYHYTQAANWPKALEFLAKAGDRAASVAADTEALSHYRRALDAYEQAFAEGWDPSQRAALLRKMAEALLRRGEHTAAVEQCYAALIALGMDYPRTRWGVRLALLRELTVQVGHRIWPRSASASLLSSDLDSMGRVLEAMAWSDYYLGDNERLFLTCVMALNESERRGDDRAIAASCFAVGIAAFCMRRPDIAIWYFRHGAQRAQRIGDPFVLGYAALGTAGHDHYARGALREAAAGYEVARDHFARARETRRWGVPTLQLGWIRLAYDLPGAETLSRELATAGEGGADPQLTAWALLLQGRLALRRGDYPEAERQLRDAAEKAKTVPDYATLVSAWGDLSIAMLARGRADEALHLAREATSLVRARDLRTPFATGAFHALARTSLAMAEGAPDKRRKAALREADAALRRCRWQSKLDRPSLPHTLRLTAALHAARGDDRNATKAWTRSVALAREHRDLYEEAQTHLAIARHTGDAAASAAARAAAQALLAELGITAAGA